MELLNKSGVIIFGSSRSKGNTFEVGKQIATLNDFDLVDLNKLDISPYDYEHRNENDDFMELAKKMSEVRVVILLSPVYWYSMSAQMKIFLDRWSDLVTIRKDLGRELKGTKLFVVSCSSERDLGEGFALPFSQTAGYMEMDYRGHYHTWKIDGKAFEPEVLKVIRTLSTKTINN